jgi:hypothetical protein
MSSGEGDLISSLMYSSTKLHQDLSIHFCHISGAEIVTITDLDVDTEETVAVATMPVRKGCSNMHGGRAQGRALSI